MVLRHQLKQPPASRVRMIERSRMPEGAKERALAKLAPELDVDPNYLRWIGHVSWLAGLADAGCTLQLEDLTAEEWESLTLWRAAQQQTASEFVKCPECGSAIEKLPDGKSPSTGCFACGWKPQK